MKPSSTAPLHRLENEWIILELDDTGRLQSFINRKTNRNYAGGRILWRLYLQEASEYDIEIRADAPEIVPRFTSGDSWLSLRYEALPCRGRLLRLTAEFRVKLQEDEIHWTVRLENQEPGTIVRECHFPLLGDLQIPADHHLIWSQNGGEKIPALHKELRQRHTEYRAPDQLYTGMTLNYPFPAATNCFLLGNEKEGLYVGCHSTPPLRTLHQFRLYPDDSLEAGMVFFPNLSEGKSVEVRTFVLSAYSGSWHVAARKYRCWADEWFHPIPAPDWIRRLNGWQRIILQHQYGEIHYAFDQLPEIHADGMKSGIDTLFMFGWHQGGHDHNYPHYAPDSRLGDGESMQRGIDHFNHRNGHVILYANGRLIDRDSDYYRSVGHRIVIKDLCGNEIPECYKFQGTGNFVREFANRTLLPVCPACHEWFNVLRNLADQTLAWKCHSLFLDQAGMSEYPCCETSHPHEPLEMNLIRYKTETLRRLREYLRERDPQVALGIELLSDVTAQHADYIHGLVGGCALLYGWERSGSKPQSVGFLEWFRYLFPEIILSDREIRDDTDIERRVNHAVLMGLRTDVEIYRCRKTVAEAPHYAEYLAQINRLRQQYAACLLEGRYVDTEGIELSNPEVDARAFVNGDRTAVVVTQSHLDSATTRIALCDGSLVECSVVGGGSAQKTADQIELTLPRHALIVLLFERTG